VYPGGRRIFAISKVIDVFADGSEKNRDGERKKSAKKIVRHVNSKRVAKKKNEKELA